jgi:hypothetical protein
MPAYNNPQQSEDPGSGSISVVHELSQFVMVNEFRIPGIQCNQY